MTTSCLKLFCALTARRVNLLASALALCGMAFAASAARADAQLYGRLDPKLHLAQHPELFAFWFVD